MKKVKKTKCKIKLNDLVRYCMRPLLIYVCVYIYIYIYIYKVNVGSKLT